MLSNTSNKFWLSALSGLVGVIVGGLTCSLVGRQSSAVVVSPNATPSEFFTDFDMYAIAETVSSRSFAQNEILSTSSSVTGGGLRWGERQFTASWESRGELREQLGQLLERKIDEALLKAGVQCSNPTTGSWGVDQPGSIFFLERRYQCPGHSGKLHLWFIAGIAGEQSSIILTIDEVA